MCVICVFLGRLQRRYRRGAKPNFRIEALSLLKELATEGGLKDAPY